MTATFKSFGNIPITIDALNISTSEEAIISNASFNNLLGILSCPVDNEVSIFERDLKPSCVVTFFI